MQDNQLNPRARLPLWAARGRSALWATRLPMLLATVLLGGAACTAQALEQVEPLSLKALVGRQMFFDPALSGSGKMSCATCHDPNNAYAPANGLALQMGGPRLDQPGPRAVPSLRYKDNTPPYADLADNPDGVSAPGPGGGFMQDGRADTLAAQAKLPLLSFNEMANKSAADVVAKMKKADYRGQFLQAFGAAALDDTKQAFDHAAEALQAFQKEDISFHPFTSKYDLYNSNKIGGDLTPAEARGLRVFLDPGKGNCFACHYSGAGLNGSVALFTDFSYAAIGVPRNMKEQPAGTARTGHGPVYDLGICGRDDHAGPKNKQYCGMFKTPTLRNVATRKVFFHNGQIKSLAEALRFYNTRDTQPALWYPKVNGRVRRFDDLPAAYHANIDTQAPLDGRKAGSKPPMTDEDLKDLEAFLDILTDGYVVPARQAARQTAK